MEVTSGLLQDLKDGYTALGSLTEDKAFVEKLLDKGKIKQEDFFKFSYAVSKALRKIKEPLETLQKEKKKVFNQFSEKIGDRVGIPVHKQDDYDAAILVLNSVSVDLDIKPIKLSFLNSINAGALVLASIAPIVEEDVDL